MKLSVYKYTEHRLRSKKDYINSYRFESKSFTTQQFDYYARYTFPQHNEITMSDNTVITVEPHDKKNLRHEVIFSMNNDVIAFYDVTKKIIFDKTHTPLIYILDDSGIPKAILTAAMQGDPKTYQLMDKSKKINYGQIRRKKLSSHFFWPFSIIDKLIRIIFTKNIRALYEIEVTSLPIEKEILMVVSAILEEGKQSTQTVT